MQNIDILSFTECEDKAYGNSIIQYKAGADLVSFAFSSVDVKEVPNKCDFISFEILIKNSSTELPSWSDLSTPMLQLIADSEFDMNFIEYEDDTWSEEMAERIWDESVAMGLNGVVIAGEDSCYLTVYAGAMCSVNWVNHPEYGKPYLDHIVEPNKDLPKSKLNEQIRTAEGKASSQSFSSGFSVLSSLDR